MEKKLEMTKLEFIHVIVRLIGILLLGYTLLTIVNLIMGLMLLSNAPPSPSLARPLVIDSIVRITIGLVGGLYLIVDGGLLISVLNRED